MEVCTEPAEVESKEMEKNLAEVGCGNLNEKLVIVCFFLIISERGLSTSRSFWKKNENGASLKSRSKS